MQALIENILEREPDQLDPGRTDRALNAPLPQDVVLTERAAAILRTYLFEQGFDKYQILYCTSLDLYGVESHLNDLDEAGARWKPLPAFSSSAESIDVMTQGKWGATRWPGGVLHLAKHGVVIARWYWVNLSENDSSILWLIAAASTDDVLRLRDDLLPFRRQGGAGVWRFISNGYADPEKLPRATDESAAPLFLSRAIEERIDAEIVRFFSPEVQSLYKTLGVPYRRGVLLYGPPGNGKTSLIRSIGIRLPNIPGFVLRPLADFDGDDLQGVVKRWTREAPAILVIEDLDWLLKQVNVSVLLNTIDGIDQSDGGLLLIATTNHPESLDPAINNRPGRFDVSLEVPNSDANLREQFFRAKLPEITDQMREQLVQDCDRLSFAHLTEVLRLSGLLAIHAGRTTRDDADLLRAAELVRASNEIAANGFPMKFGLAPRRKS